MCTAHAKPQISLWAVSIQVTHAKQLQKPKSVHNYVVLHALHTNRQTDINHVNHMLKESVLVLKNIDVTK